MGNNWRRMVRKELFSFQRWEPIARMVIKKGAGCLKPCRFRNKHIFSDNDGEPGGYGVNTSQVKINGNNAAVGGERCGCEARNTHTRGAEAGR